MGRQVNFFMGSHDVEEFVNFVLKNKDVAIVINGQRTEKESIVDSFPENAYCIHFWNKSISPLPVFDYIEKQRCFSIDFFVSEVVEFSKNKCLRPCILDERRIWVDTAYVENGVWVSKSKQFIAWYESLARWIKKRAVGKRNWFYVMKEAASLFREHGTKIQEF